MSWPPRLLALAGCVLVTTGGALGAARAARSDDRFAVNGDLAIGTYSTWRHGGRLAAAIAAFGEPAQVLPGPGKPHPGTCVARWPAVGLRIKFYWYTGLGSACVPENGCFFEAFITDRRWHTTRGLSIGDRRQRLYTLYPNIHVHPSGWRALIVREGPAAPFDTFSIKLTNGRVSAFRIRGLPCGI